MRFRSKQLLLNTLCSFLIKLTILFYWNNRDLILLKVFNSSQVGSLAGAAHLLNANAGVLRVTPQEQKSCLEYKGKSYLDKFIQ